MTVPYGYSGILYEKIDGWQKPPLEEGYHWISTGFIPEKWKLYLVDLSPPAITVDYSKGLKYSGYLKLSEAFNLQISLRVKYTINQESSYQLLEYLEGDIASLSERIREKIKILLDFKFYEFYKEQTDIPVLRVKFLDYLTANREENSFSADFKNIFSHEKINLIKIDVLKTYVPDEDIYAEQIKNIGELFKARREASINKIFNESAVEKIRFENEAAVEKARKISELIKENPAILDYLKFEEINKNTKVVYIDGESKKSNVNRSLGVSSSNEASSEDTEGKVPPLNKQ
ncbi:MAG: hypothetical protein OEZ13_00560 [Spirochaetia bacterium]|nr:hypothetical protein [Spirochaetia bacterium]